MEFNYAYSGSSTVQSNGGATNLSFAPDTLRKPTFFRGRLKASLAFREAMSALHDVVVSDLRWKPKDKTAYKEWLARQELVDWAAVAAQQKATQEKIESLRLELSEIHRRRASGMGVFEAKKQEYFRYILTRDYSAWLVLDPVITVHPDELFFECFSKDESSYARLGVGYDVFDDVGDFACGTTNIDYSEALYDEFQKIRSYKDTRFEIDPSGFEVRTEGEAAHKEVKIDLPDSWVRGFLQVSSAMAMPAASFDLHPVDIHNICHVLRRNKEILGPRGMRWILEPGAPVRVIFEPWEIELKCPRTVFEGHKKQEIRTWGRRRIHVLERLIPWAKSFRVHLLGYGMPSFFVAKLPDLNFTLGLSGWTKNDWAQSANFDLLAPRASVDRFTCEKVFSALQENWRESPDSLAARLKIDRSVVLSALAIYTQEGRAIWDLDKQMYRVRELSREPLPMDSLRFSNEREAAATRLVDLVAKWNVVTSDEGRSLTGEVEDQGRLLLTSLQLDRDQGMKEGRCQCDWHRQNALRKGPCEHLLALRLRDARESTNRER